MNLLGPFLLGLVLLALQTTAFRFLGVSSLRAPLVLPVVLFAAFRLEPTRGLILAFLLGYASDLFGGGTKGIGPLVMILLCLIGHWMRRGLLLKGPWALGFMAGPFGFFHGVLFMGMGAVVEGSLWLEDLRPTQLLVQAGVLWVLGPALVWLCGLTERLVKRGFGRNRHVRT
jgi:cell shape-determining protein MreD